MHCRHSSLAHPHPRQSYDMHVKRPSWEMGKRAWGCPGTQGVHGTKAGLMEGMVGTTRPFAVTTLISSSNAMAGAVGCALFGLGENILPRLENGVGAGVDVLLVWFALGPAATIRALPAEVATVV